MSHDGATAPKRFASRVLDRVQVCEEHARLRLHVDETFRATPGQFVQILCADLGVARATSFLRKPFSIAALRTHEKGTVLEILFRVVGPGTVWLDARRAGDVVDFIGPLGNGFRIDASCKLAYLVAGGVGLPPVAMWAQELANRQVERLAFVGAASERLIPLEFARGSEPPGDWRHGTRTALEFDESNTPLVISTDDGSTGFKGTVLDALRARFGKNRPDANSLVIYACGPTRMLEAVALQASGWGVQCQLALETLMACGIGTCQSCAVRVRDAASADGWRYKLCCKDGPVFDGDQLIW